VRWDGLNEAEQIDIAAVVGLLEHEGPNLKFPFSSGIQSSKHTHFRELRVQHRGKPYRVIYAFDPRRCAILLVGGNKQGYKRWYEKYVPIADQLYDKHLEALERE